MVVKLCYIPIGIRKLSFFVFLASNWPSSFCGIETC